jgi:5'-nucleotidase/UDP-sugar diphosphatase
LSGVELITANGVLLQARIGGAFVESAKTYTMAFNSFTAAGGDGYPVRTAHPGFVNTGFVDAEVLRGYIAAYSPLQVQHYAPSAPLAASPIQ